MIKLIKSENFKYYILLLIVSIIISIPLFNPSFDIKQGDGILHLSRIMGTFSALLDGQKFPNIMINFCNGFGYNWNTFYSPSTVYFPLFLKILTNSFGLALKIFMTCTVFLSGIFMYKFVKETTNSKNIGIISGVIYITLPYRLTDMYIRIAVSELAAFMFLPLIFLGLNNIINKNIKNDYYSSIGATGLLLTHNISTLIASIFCIFFILFNIKKINLEIFKSLITNAIFIITITSFFWAPMLEAGTLSQYEVFIPNRMGSVDSVRRNGIKFTQLLYTRFQDEFIFEIGIVNFIISLTTFYCFRRVKKEYKIIYLTFLCFGILSMLMATKYFPWHIMPSIFGIIQFPWRMLMFAGFFLSFVCSINIYIVFKEIKKHHIFLITCIFISYASIVIPHLKYDNSFNELDYWYGNEVTLDKEKINSACASFEYLPAKAQNNKEYILTRVDKAIVLEGDGEIVQQIKNGTHMEIYFSNIHEDILMELPYIYYPGYKVEVVTNEKILRLQTNETKNGFVGVNIPKSVDAFLKVSYGGTIVMKLSTMISIIGVIILVAYIIKKVFIKKVKKKRI